MADGSDAIADWPLLNALVNTASGASWVSIHHGGGVGIGRSIHAGQVCVADGTPLAGEKLERVRTNPRHGRDPARGRGYEEAARWPRSGACASRCSRDEHARSPAFGSLGRRCFRSAGTRRPAATGGFPGPGLTGTAGTGSRPRPGNGSCAPARTATATSGPGGMWPGSAAGGLPAAVATGSHLDSVPDGGAYDGPLGVVSAFAAIDELRAGGFVPFRPIAVAAFTEEEGARFGVACLGSRLLTGAIDPDRARGLRDGDGITLAGAMQAAGRDPGQIGRDDDLIVRSAATSSCISSRAGAWRTSAPPWASPRGSGRTPVAAGFCRRLSAGPPRWRTARPDDPLRGHRAGRPRGRHRARRPGHVGKVTAVPGAANAVCSSVRAWLDVRAADGRTLEDTVDQILAAAGQESAANRVTLTSARSRSAPRSSSMPRWRAGWPRCWPPAGSTRPPCPPGPGTTPGCWPTGCPPPCCSSATSPGCPTHRRSMPMTGTARPGSPRSRPSCATWPADDGPPAGPGRAGVRRWHAELAWLGPGEVRSGVLIEATGPCSGP